MYALVKILNYLLPVLYGITFAVYLYDFFRNEVKLAKAKRRLLSATLLLHVFYLLARTIEFDHPPITTVFEIFTILAFALSCSYLILELLTNIRGTGSFVIIFSVIFQLVSSLFIQDLTEVREVLRNHLLGLHVLSAILGYSGITVSAIYGFLYLALYKEIKLNRFGLIFERLPNLEILEELSFYSACIGFTLLTVAIIIGMIWLPAAFPNFNYFDSKLIGTMLIWIIYGFGILSKTLAKWQGKKVVIFSIIGFLIAIVQTVLSNFILKSFHAFY